MALDNAIGCERQECPVATTVIKQLLRVLPNKLKGLLEARLMTPREDLVFIGDLRLW